MQTRLNDYRLAQESDFVITIRRYERDYPTTKLTRSAFEADLNQNLLNDYALLLVAEDNTHFRFLITLNQGKGEFSDAVVKDYESISQTSLGIVYTSMGYKPPGDLGITQREYSPIRPKKY